MIQTIDLHLDVDLATDVEGKPNPIVQRKSISTFVVFSVVAHIVIGFIVIHFSNFGGMPTSDSFTQDIQPIKATLYYPPIPQTKNEQDILPPEPLPLVEEHVADIPENVEPAIEEPNHTEPEAVITEPPDMAMQDVEPIVEERNETPLQSNSTVSDMTETQQSSHARMERLNRALSSHLNNFQEQKNSELSESYSENYDQIYYQQQTQGLTYAAPQQIDNGLNESEEMLNSGLEMSSSHQANFEPTTVDCTSTRGKVAQTMSIFVGGRIKCTELPDFQKYIDARLNKK